MKNKFVLSLVALCAFSFNAVPLVKANVKAPSAIPATPPAPKFTDAERQSELAGRRAEIAKKMQPNSVMILWSAEPRNYAGDVEYKFRQENDFYYLTNLNQRGSAYVLVKNGDQVQEFLFLPRRNPAAETWNGKMYSREDATRLSGLKTIIDSSELRAFTTAFGKKEAFTSKEGVNISPSGEAVYLLLPENENDGDGMAEFRRENDFSKGLTGYKVQNIRAVFDEHRHVKSPMELKLMQHAIDISTEAHLRAMATAKNMKWEYETQAEVEYIFRKRNADYWGYSSIVGCGPNATTLHYIESQGEIKPNALLLMDVGAEYDHYTADITRTFPVNGKFSKDQAEVYQIVYDAQEAVAKVTKPGARMGQIEGASSDVISKGLAKLGLITAPDATFEAVFNGQTVKIPQYRIWYMHGNSHWLGMNVHDVGSYQAPLKAGMVFTNEPGIYVREDALSYLADTPGNKDFIAKVKPAFEKYKNIGVRIEDDMLVTETGVDWMTKKLPRTMAEIEAFMAKASKEFPGTAMSENKPNLNMAFLSYKENLLLPQNNYDVYNFAAFPQGKTTRSSWIWSGKQTTQAGLAHADSHGE